MRGYLAAAQPPVRASDQGVLQLIGLPKPTETAALAVATPTAPVGGVHPDRTTEGL